MSIPAMFAVFVALATTLAIAGVNGEEKSALAGCGDVKALQKDMDNCFASSGINMTQINGDIQAGLTQAQAQKDQIKKLCANNSLIKMIDCAYKLVEDKCSGAVYKIFDQIYNKEKMKKMMTYGCDNIDALTSSKTRDCMTSFNKSFAGCAKPRIQEAALKVQKEEDKQKQVIMSVCYGHGITNTCLKKICPTNGEHILKLMSFLIPDECSEYIDSSASMSTGSFNLLSLLTFIATLRLVFH